MAWFGATGGGRHDRRSSRGTARGGDRLSWLRIGTVLMAVLLASRLFFLQVVQAGYWNIIAQDQHQLNEQLLPTRGQILVHDNQSTTGSYPMATNRTLHLLYAIPKQIPHPAEVTMALEKYVTLDRDTLLSRLSKANDLYEPLQHNMTDEQMKAIQDLKLPGLDFIDEQVRYYPEKTVGSQVLGFVGFSKDVKIGQYGVEGTAEKELAGKQGFLRAQKDASGGLIASAAEAWQPAVNGSDILLTLDRTIQYETCHQLEDWVIKHGADGGSVTIVNPKTGAILALCGAPDFDPNEYGKVGDIKNYLNPALQTPYEPGSVFKPITMSAAIDQGRVTPETTYTDTGEVKIASYTIKNSDLKANGVQNMTQVLEKSLNTGAIFAMQQVGPQTFGKYVHDYGFGTNTNVGLSEVSGNISKLDTGKDIYAMTGSFGQGITVTPLQLTMAYAAIANGGKLMRPYIVEEIRRPDGTVIKTEPQTVRQVVSQKTAATVGAMLVRVVQNGHGQKAGVPGYFVAGKTGTAQVPDPQSGGYLNNVTIGSFAGFAPVEDPKFVMLVRIDRPRDVQFAESSAAPLFGSLAKFLLSYYHVSPVATIPTTP